MEKKKTARRSFATARQLVYDVINLRTPLEIGDELVIDSSRPRTEYISRTDGLSTLTTLTLTLDRTLVSETEYSMEISSPTTKTITFSMQRNFLKGRDSDFEKMLNQYELLAGDKQ